MSQLAARKPVQARRARSNTSDVPVGSAFHARTLELCESLNYRDWAGYYAVSAYETHHEHEYNAIRNACALIDISPLFKYRVSGPDAMRLVNRVITRDASRMTRRPGLLHAVVRRRRQGDRRWDGDAGVGAGVSMDRGRSEPALAHRERIRTERRHRGHFRERRRAGAAGADVGAAAAAGVRRGSVDAEVLPRHQRPHRRRAGRRVAHRLHRRSRLRDLDAVGRGAAGLGRDRAARAARSICIRPACWRSTSRASRPGCC